MSNQYSIALLHYSCPPVVGGVEEIIRQQASLFHRYGHFVKIFVGEGKNFSDNYDVECNPMMSSQNYSIREYQQFLQKGEPEDPYEHVDEIYAYLKNVMKDFDLVIAHNVFCMPYNFPLTVALNRIAEKRLLPLISWNHDSPYFYDDYPRYLDKTPWNILKRANKAVHYVTISHSRKKMFSKLYGPEIEVKVIPNGIDPIRFFRLDPIIVKLIQEQKLFEAEFLMVQPSRLHPRKNIELSIHVTRALKDLGCRAKMLITGAYDPHEPQTWDYYTRLRELIEKLGLEEEVLIMAEYVFKSGQRLFLDRIVIRDLYLIADILFLPSLQEGFGIPLLESGMIKLPIVCSDIPPFREIGGGDVCLFSIEDSPEEIARRVLDFANKLEPRRMFRKVVKNYVWDNIYHKTLLPFIQGILEGKTR